MGPPAANANIYSSRGFTENAASLSQPLEYDKHVFASSSGNRYFDGRPRSRSYHSQTDNKPPDSALNREPTSTNNTHQGNDDTAEPPRSSTALGYLGSYLQTGSISNATAHGSHQRDPALRPRSRLTNPGSLWYGGDAARAARRLGLDWIWPDSGFTGVSTHDQYPRTDLLDGRQPNPPTNGAAVRSHDEPPDGGALAWAHVFVGFIVCLNTQ